MLQIFACQAQKYVLKAAKQSGRSSAWLERQLWELDAGGSNPLAPTKSSLIQSPGAK